MHHSGGDDASLKAVERWFVRRIGPELRQALAVRVLYRQVLAGHDGSGEVTR